MYDDLIFKTFNQTTTGTCTSYPNDVIRKIIMLSAEKGIDLNTFRPGQKEDSIGSNNSLLIVMKPASPENVFTKESKVILE